MLDLPALYRVGHGEFRLDRHDPGAVVEGLDKRTGRQMLAQSVKHLAGLQRVLAANASHAVLVVIQAMDAGGKDGTIRHVMSGVNPQGVRVSSFKQPSATQLGQDFLRRVHSEVPSPGEIGLFNRSHYEDVLVARVHPERLDPRLQQAARHERFWNGRLEDIAAFESYLARQGVVVRKVFLHISKEEQRLRLLNRLDHPDKIWKLSAADLTERQYWDQYQRAYEAAIAATSTKAAPWFVVPADHKWFAWLVVVEIVVQALQELGLAMPAPGDGSGELLRQAREVLETEHGARKRKAKAGPKAG